MRKEALDRMQPLGHRLAPPRFLMFLLLFAGTLTTLALLFNMKAAEATLIAFDIAAAAFLISLWPLLKNAKPAAMRAHAAANDAGRLLVLILTAIVGGIIFVSVGLELLGGERTGPAIAALVIVTLILSWIFSNSIYALHYAHLFYSSAEAGKDKAGLGFPGTENPDYHDFFYFAYTLGMTFQTSDVEITARHMRRVATWHSLAAFLFNIGIIAFTINILGGK